MRPAHLIPAALALACLLALRPAGPTFPELVSRVEALEGRVKALEAGQPPAKAAKPGDIVVGMTEAQARQSIIAGNRTLSRPSESIETDGRVRSTWYLNADPRDSTEAKVIHFENGVVTRVDR